MQLSQKSLLGALLGSGLWGLSGTASQALLQGFGFPVLGLVALRMLLSALLLQLIFRPAFPPKPRARLVLVSVFGLAGSQITYLGAIAFSNVATATLLQFLFLPIVAVYEKATGVLQWSLRWTVALVVAMVGTLLLVIGAEGLLVTPLGVLSGLAAALAGAYYSLGSKSWVRKYGSRWVLSWGFLFGGLAALPLGVGSLLQYAPPTTMAGVDELVFLISVVIVVGTILAFGLYLYGLRGLSATEAGVASSAEPIVAAIAAFAFLGVVLTFEQYLGGALILSAVVILGSRRSNSVVVAQPTG